MSSALRQIAVLFPWKPHAKQRPRKAANGHIYTPPATQDAEAAIAAAFTAEAGTGFTPFDGPVVVELVLYKSGLHVNVRESARRKVLRGDLDNYAKTVLDALNGVAWLDDRQIVDLRVWEAE